MIGQAFTSPITGVPGWETEDEQALLVSLAQQVPEGGTILEIGGEFGMSASLFANGAKPDVKIVTVDLFPGALLDTHVSNLREAGYEGRTEQVQGNSPDVGRDWKGVNIDLLFIDGDHTFEGVGADIEAWAGHVKKDGMIVFHDCASQTNKLPHALHFEVTRAVSEWFFETKGKFALVDSVDSILVFKRVK